MKNLDEKKIIKEENKKKINIELLIYIIFILVFLFAFLVPFDEVQDPWKKAILLIDSSRKEANPQKKSEMFENGGKQLMNLLKEHPYHARLHFMVGYYKYLDNKYDAAMTYLRKSIEIDSGGYMNSVTPEAQNLMTIIVLNKIKEFIGSGNYQEAYNFIKPYEYLKRQSLEMNYHLGIIYQGLNKLDSAEKHYRIVLANKPNFEQARINLGIVYFNKGNHYREKGELDTALDYYNRAISLGLINSLSLANLALVYYKKGNYYESANYFREALRYDSNNKSIIQSLAAVYNKIGMKDSAMYYLERLKAMQ